MATHCPLYVFTTSTVPATGPRGARGNFGSALLSVSSSLRYRSVYDVPLKGMAALLARPSRAVTPPEAAQRFAPAGAKGLTARSSGRGTIDLAPGKLRS